MDPVALLHRDVELLDELSDLLDDRGCGQLAAVRIGLERAIATIEGRETPAEAPSPETPLTRFLAATASGLLQPPLTPEQLRARLADIAQPDEAPARDLPATVTPMEEVLAEEVLAAEPMEPPPEPAARRRQQQKGAAA